MPELAKEYRALVVNSLDDRLPGLYLLLAVDAWCVRVAPAFRRHDGGLRDHQTAFGCALRVVGCGCWLRRIVNGSLAGQRGCNTKTITSFTKGGCLCGAQIETQRMLNDIKIMISKLCRSYCRDERVF